MEYVKKPIVVHAEQWFPEVYTPWVQVELIIDGDETTEGYFIVTLEGSMSIHPGDWIITGIAGEHYPCRNDIFEKTYEPVDKSIRECVD